MLELWKHFHALNLPVGRREKVLRVLRPGGVAVVGSTVPDAVSDRFTDNLKKWADADSVESLTSPVKSVVVLRRRMPQGIDSWTHWEHGPDNNPVSEDQVIKARKPIAAGVTPISFVIE